VRRADGALLTASVPPYVSMLHTAVVGTSSTAAAGATAATATASGSSSAGSARWDEALRLCRAVKSDQLWAAAAAMALQGRNLGMCDSPHHSVHVSLYMYVYVYIYIYICINHGVY
jgi:hypothetical protein